MSIALPLVFVGLLMCSAFFSGSEVALFSLRRFRVERYKLEPSRGARRVAELLRDPRKLLVTLLIGNETVNIAIANVGSEWRRDVETLLPDEAALWIRPLAALAVTLVLVIFGEITPKNVAIGMPERWALAASWPLTQFGRLVAPARSSLAALVGLLSGRSGEKAMTEEDLRLLLSEGERAGVLRPAERELILSVFEFRDATVRSLLTPRADIRSIPAGVSLEEAVAFAVRHKYSRIPVYDGSPDDIVGVVYANDLLAWRYGLRAADGLRALMRPALLVPDGKKARDLLREFQAKSVQLAVVVDEYGATAGIVTMDDLLAEIVGEIADSFDTQVAPFTEIAPRTYRVLARMELADLEARLGARLAGGGVRTVGGFVLRTLGRLPRQGDGVDTSGLRFTVLGMAGRQIVTLLVRDRRAEGGS